MEREPEGLIFFLFFLKCSIYHQVKDVGGVKIYLGLAKIASFCSWFNSRMEDVESVQDFIFLFLVLIKGLRR